MASQLVNHTIPNLVAGVSQQFTESRFETQVTEMINCVPSLARGILRRNPLKNKLSLANFDNDYFTYTYDRGTGTEQYLVCIGSSSDWYVYNLNTGELKGSGTDSYLTIGAGEKPKDMFRCVTIGDYTFVVNRSVTVTMNPTTTEQTNNLSLWENKMVYWIKKTTSVVISQYSEGTNDDTSGDSTNNTGTLLEGYSYTLTRDGTSTTVLATKDTRPSYTAVDRLSSTEIAEYMATTMGISSKETYVYDNSTTSDWTYSDSFGDEASLLIWKDVRNASELPATLPNEIGDKIVKISGVLEGSLDDYYMRYDSSNKSWSETVAPNIPTELTATTMPHVFIRQADLSFTFEEYDWEDRTAGDEESIEDPSFVDKTITNIFFHKNRLGFITNDSVVLSETGEYGNFFGTTVQSLPDDDPIDLLVATTDVTVLRHAVSAAGTLILFSDDAQFTLSSGQGPLTPSSANIETVSNYTYSNSTDAVALGNKVYFVSESGGYSQIYAYRLTEGLQITEAQALTSHIPSYIPTGIKLITGHSVLGYNFFWSENSKQTIYVLSNISIGNEDVQNAFHKWTFAKDILGTHVINNKLYVVFEDGTLASLSLEIPGDITSVVYQDIDNMDYLSDILLSEFHLRDSDGKGTTRGRTQLRTMQYTVTEDSFWKTSIYNKQLSSQVENTTWLLRTAYWDDTGTWVDSSLWRDALALYTREYYNDERVSITANARTTQIEISNDDTNPTKGFEIATINIEAFFHQRSTRY